MVFLISMQQSVLYPSGSGRLRGALAVEIRCVFTASHKASPDAMSLRPKRELSATPTPVSRLDQVLRVGVAKTSMPVFEQERILLRKIKEANDRHDDSEELRLSRELGQLTEKRKKDESELVERRVSTAHIQAKLDAEEAKLKREKAIRQLSSNRKDRLLQLLLKKIRGRSCRRTLS